ncbi:MAG TPA: hypothetical protein VFI96_03505 [Longimicrobiaceae bacterium]|nr:hypothetical protein [Longimicrobiaceae bacterium]
MIFDLMQYIGAALVLAGFAANARGWLEAGSTAYLVINFLGAALLVTSAYAAAQWGFVLLNVVWAVVALVGLAQAGLRQMPSGPTLRHTAAGFRRGRTVPQRA